VWAYAIVEHCPPSTVAQHPPPIQALLAEYSDLFQLPQTLPPQRIHDHAIPLAWSSPYQQQTIQILPCPQD